MECKYLTGENIKPRTIKEARLLIGKRVSYLRDSDIDKSGRGYIFPQYGWIESAKGRHIVITGDYVHMSNLREMILQVVA